MKYKVLNSRSFAILEEGAIYSYGRDFYYRPIIIVSMSKIDLTKVILTTT